MKKYAMMILALLVAALAAASCSPPPPPNDGGNDQDVVMNDGQTNPDGVSTPDGGSDTTDAMFVEVTPMTCVSVDTPGQRCDVNEDCCSNRCDDFNHRCIPNEHIMTPCANPTDCPGQGFDGSYGLCGLVPLPDGGTGMRCTVYPVGMSCDPNMRQCPGVCRTTTMTCQPAPQGSPCMMSRGDADCMSGLSCVDDGTGSGGGGCQPR